MYNENYIIRRVYCAVTALSALQLFRNTTVVTKCVSATMLLLHKNTYLIYIQSIFPYKWTCHVYFCTWLMTKQGKNSEIKNMWRSNTARSTARNIPGILIYHVQICLLCWPLKTDFICMKTSFPFISVWI